MPGVASIKLICEPIGNYRYVKLKKLQPVFDAIFTRELERKWEGLIFTDNPEWDELVSRLDKVVKKTAVGRNKVGAVTPDPSSNAGPGSWGTKLHSATRKLLLNGEPFTITAGPKVLARIIGEYSSQPGNVLAK